MSKETCILTTKDFTILEVMRDRCLGREDPLAPLLDRKIETATAVFRDHIPQDVATVRSRITFSVDGRDPDTRVLSNDTMTSPIGMFLSIATSRGLALLGLAEGQEFILTTGEGVTERIVLEKVHYQPEAALREKESLERPAGYRGKPSMRLIRGALYGQAPLVVAATEGPDDPGPSAA